MVSITYLLGILAQHRSLGKKSHKGTLSFFLHWQFIRCFSQNLKWQKKTYFPAKLRRFIFTLLFLKCVKGWKFIYQIYKFQIQDILKSKDDISRFPSTNKISVIFAQSITSLFLKASWARCIRRVVRACLTEGCVDICPCQT